MKAKNIENLGYQIFKVQDINPSLLGITSRQINYWIDKNIIPFVEKQQLVENPSEKEKGLTHKWVRLNLSQAVWALIVKELFRYSIPLANIQKFAENIWQKHSEERYAENVFRYHIQRNPHGLSKKQIAMLEENLKDELLMQHYLRTVINPFTDMVKSVFYRNGMPHTLLYVPETNEHEFHYGDSGLIIDLGSSFLRNTILCIPIVPLMSKVLLLDYDNKRKKDLDYLTNVERQIRDIVVFKRPKAVEIAFEGSEIKPIVVTEEHKSREQLAQYILHNKIQRGSKLLIDIRSNDNYKITLIKK